MKITFQLILISICILCSGFIVAEENIEQRIIGNLLGAIEISGNSRTQASVIFRELLLRKGKVLTRNDINESRTRLKNLQIFSAVKFNFASDNNGLVRLDIEVSERWTTIPIVKLGSGGGSQFYTLGAYDINMLGRYWELGAQYENLNGNNAGVTWFRNPRLFGHRMLFGYDIWGVIRNRELYDRDGELLSAYTMDKNRLHFFLKKELLWWLEIGTGLDYVTMKLDASELNAEQNQANVDSNFTFSEDGRHTYLDFDIRLGRLNYDNYLVAGWQTDFEYKIADKSLGSTTTQYKLLIKNRLFFTISNNSTLGFGAVMGHTNSKLLQDQFYVGGLSEVRGFKDGEFIGSSFWQVNAEFRLPTIRKRNFVLQNVVFIDSGNVADSFSDALESKQQTFNSIGTGIRLISPKIYRFNFRIDVAKTFGRRDDVDISFGLQQFF